MMKMLKPSFKQILAPSNGCYNVKTDRGQNLFRGMHYHSEIELILIRRSRGTCLVGHSVEQFADKDLFLIGANTPHAFLHDEECLKEKNISAEALVIQFSENFLGNGFLRIPELREIQELLLESRHGMVVTEVGKQRVIPLMERLFTCSSLEGIIVVLDILRQLVPAANHRVLTGSNSFHNYASGINDHRFNNVLDYTYANYDEHITLEKVARIANLTRESFCRYFKTLVNKTYLEFLTEYRIDRACHMIRDGKKSIKEIAYCCGFDSLSNFYYQFKRIMKLSPLAFSRQHGRDVGAKKVA